MFYKKKIILKYDERSKGNFYKFTSELIKALYDSEMYINISINSEENTMEMNSTKRFKLFVEKISDNGREMIIIIDTEEPEEDFRIIPDNSGTVFKIRRRLSQENVKLCLKNNEVKFICGVLITDKNPVTDDELKDKFAKWVKENNWEFEGELIPKHIGLKRKENKKPNGRPCIKVDEEKFKEVYKGVEEGSYTNVEAMRMLKLSKSTYYRRLKEIMKKENKDV